MQRAGSGVGKAMLVPRRHHQLPVGQRGAAVADPLHQIVALADEQGDHGRPHLPPAFGANVNTSEAPYNRHPGEAPALSDAEIDDVIAFLETLSDGYTP